MLEENLKHFWLDLKDFERIANSLWECYEFYFRKSFKTISDKNILEEKLYRSVFRQNSYGKANKELKEFFRKNITIKDFIYSKYFKSSLKETIYWYSQEWKFWKDLKITTEIFKNLNNFVFILENFEDFLNHKNELFEWSKKSKRSEMNYVELKKYIKWEFDLKHIEIKDYRLWLIEMFWETVNHCLTEKKLYLLRNRFSIEEVKEKVFSMWIENQKITFIYDFLMWKIWEEEIIYKKKYDKLYEKFWFKFVTLTKEKRDILINLPKEDFENLTYEKIREMFKRKSNYQKINYKVDEKLLENNKKEFIELFWFQTFNWLSKWLKTKIIKEIWFEKSKEILKYHKDYFYYWKARFVLKYFEIWKKIIDYCELEHHFWEEFSKYINFNLKEKIYQYWYKKVIENAEKWKLREFIEKKILKVVEDSEDYKNFRKYYWHSFSTQTKEFREKLEKEIWFKTVYKFQQENWIDNKLTLRAFLYWKDWIKNWRIYCDCWCKNWYEINFGNLKIIERWLLFPCCKKVYRSSYEKVLHKIILELWYKWEILINQIIVKELWRKWEIDIYLPDKKFWIEFNGTFYHLRKSDKLFVIKKELSNKMWIDLIALDEFDMWDKIKQTKQLLKNKLFNNN